MFQSFPRRPGPWASLSHLQQDALQSDGTEPLKICLGLNLEWFSRWKEESWVLVAVSDSEEGRRYLEIGVKAGWPAESLVIFTPFDDGLCELSTLLSVLPCCNGCQQKLKLFYPASEM